MVGEIEVSGNKEALIVLAGTVAGAATTFAALENEICHWKHFRNALSSDDEKLAFDDIMDMCRSNAMAAGNACSPIIFEPMVLSIFIKSAKKD